MLLVVVVLVEVAVVGLDAAVPLLFLVWVANAARVASSLAIESAERDP